jgi:Dipeptidyl peptidase IV (DPP IV) N-terminal region
MNNLAQLFLRVIKSFASFTDISLSKNSNFSGYFRYFIYEMESSNISPLAVNKTAVSLLQKVVWAPNNNETEPGKSQAIAFVHKYDIFYKPRVQDDTVVRITTTGESNVNKWRKEKHQQHRNECLKKLAVFVGETFPASLFGQKKLNNFSLDNGEMR